MTRKNSVRILLVDDEKIIHQTIGDYLSESGHLVDNAYEGQTALDWVKNKHYDVALLDVKMPKMDGIALMAKIQEIDPLLPIVIITGHGNMETVIESLRLGAADFLPKPVKLLELDAVLEKCFHLLTLRRESHHLHMAFKAIQFSRTGGQKFVGTSSLTDKIREQIHQIIAADCRTILITGETGAGKEVVARQIHHQAGGDENPFIAVSCPALSESLLESELFGHMRGAFTGAVRDQAGYFEMAEGGTLFLDEIGDMPSVTQTKLLRALETRTIRRIGDSEEIHVNIRVIAATNAELEELIETGRFRQDLYYRLNLYSIRIPPLRERREDILPLAEYFLSNYATARNLHFQGFSSEAKDLLVNYDFPGNVRELSNIVERSAMLCEGNQIQAKHLHLFKTLNKKDTSLPPNSKQDEKHRLLKALEEARWNRRQAAKNLNLPYSTLRYKMNKLGIG